MMTVWTKEHDNKRLVFFQTFLCDQRIIRFQQRYRGYYRETFEQCRSILLRNALVTKNYQRNESDQASQNIFFSKIYLNASEPHFILLTKKSEEKSWSSTKLP
jgi:hypothetical protein